MASLWEFQFATSLGGFHRGFSSNFGMNILYVKAFNEMDELFFQISIFCDFVFKFLKNSHLLMMGS